MCSSFRYAVSRALSDILGSPMTNVVRQRNLNNSFAYDLVPSPSVIVAALKAARRVNDYPTAVRIFEGAFGSWEPVLLARGWMQPIVGGGC